jgi:hypothetical protein
VGASTSHNPMGLHGLLVGYLYRFFLAVYCQSVSLGDKLLETHDQKFFKLNTCFHSPYLTSSLTRGWVCNLLLLLALATTVIRRHESRGTREHIILSRRRDSPNLEDQVSVFISPQEQGGPYISPGTGFPFRRPLRLAELRWRYSTPSPHRSFSQRWL